MNREYPEQPLVGIGVVVMGLQGVLLVKRGKPPREGEWSLPGGAQKLGETVFEAARREVMEETGLSIGILGLVDVVDSIRRDDAGKVQYHYTLVDILGRIPPNSETEPSPGSDADEAAWIPLVDVPGLGLWSETERIINLAVEMLEQVDPADR
jgi:ADP-ribose pyrophosphatase YjhB (NUDIX family)|tara:strand:- start:31 stop:489 length:459 start_codon:yes stop_codon:yes gene_type:complete